MNFVQIKRCAHFESFLGQNKNKKIIAYTALSFWLCYAKQRINVFWPKWKEISIIVSIILFKKNYIFNNVMPFFYGLSASFY